MCVVFEQEEGSKQASMHWRKKKVSDFAIAIADERRLLERGSMEKKSVAKGYVPVLVGWSHGDLDAETRVMVPVKLFKEPCMKKLLDEAAVEFGYTHEGVLRIPCDVQEFRQVISTACGLQE